MFEKFEKIEKVIFGFIYVLLLVALVLILNAK